jgi:hypothetical protein
LIGSGSYSTANILIRSANRTAAVAAAVSVLVVVLHFANNFKAHFLIPEQKIISNGKS